MVISADAGPGRSVQTTWTYTLGSMVFVLVMLDAALLAMALPSFKKWDDAVAGLLLVALVAASAMHVRYSWFLRAGLGGGLPRPAWTAALLMPGAAAWVLGLFSPENTAISTIPLWLAACLISCLLPTRARLAVLAAGLGVALVHPVLFGLVTGQPYSWGSGSGMMMAYFYAAFMPLMLLSSLWWWEKVVELDRHRRMAGELAVAQERLRFAADLHDIQGHHLQVIALKSELAERLLTRDVEAARGHIHETRMIAKQALEETRSLVSGYREIALDNELENAREVLNAAGAQCELTLDPLPGNPAVHRALAMSVREATTNILRHSEATRASITLSTSPTGCSLAISNNGAAPSPPSSKAPSSGLAGLRARVEALGGTLESKLSADRFELRVWVPTIEGTIA